MTLAATLDVLLDRRLTRADLLVYGALLRDTDPMAYRPVKLARIARATGLQERHALRAIKHLRARGYLERGPTAEGRVNTYRPLPTRGECPALGTKSPHQP